MESAPLVKEILREKEEYCVGSRESSSVVVSKKRRLPFRHVQQKTIPRLLKTVTVYLLKFRWHLWDLVWLFSRFQFLVATSKTGRSSALFNTPAFLRYSVIWDRFALMKSSNYAFYRTGVSVWIVVEYDAIDDNYSECQPDKSDSPGKYSSSRYSRMHKETVWPSELVRTSRMFFFVVAPVALIHWKCFVVLMSALQYLQREEFRVHGRATGDSHSVSDVKSTRMQVSN